MKPSVTLLFAFIFFMFILHSIWNLIEIFQPPKCNPGESCCRSFLNSKPPMELFLYISDSLRLNSGQLIYHSHNFDYSNSFEQEFLINIPESTRNNGTLYIHIVFLPTRKEKTVLKLADASYMPDAVYIRKRLTDYAVPKTSTFNLLKDKSKLQLSKRVTHLKGRFAIMILTEELNIPLHSIPMEISQHINVNHKHQFMPIIQQDFMQTRMKDLIEITPESKKMSFIFSYAPSSIGKLRFLLQTEATLIQFIQLGFTEKDLDEIKGVFADTNLYLLCATVFIGSIHLLFDFLSFKNDVNFWKTNNSMAGLSTRTVLWRSFSQTVVFLFLVEEGTSLIVLIPCGIATIIEFWKIKKVLKLSVVWQNGPCIKFDRNSRETQEEAQTREYDEECMTYLSYLLYPLCLGAAIYSLIYQPHKSWYSWTINSLVNGVYAFGFLFMLPQLFVNYRLKSVAALPWKAFMYRAFNTFIDDVFAFVITMPTAHRVACFRDDIVFIIYLYQRWLYPVDQSRSDDISMECEERDKKNL